MNQNNQEPVPATEAVEPAAEQTEEAPPGEVETLRHELEQARAQAQEYLDGWQRARAELANARKRFEKERAEAGLYANAELMRKLLPISDDLERALATLPDDLKGHTWVEGIALIYRKLQTAFEATGVTPIAVQAGDEFNPDIHEAVTHEENGEIEPGKIIAPVQTGYRLGENILRPALVRVAK